MMQQNLSNGEQKAKFTNNINISYDKEDNKKILNGYKIIKKNIGEGSYGKIKLVQSVENKQIYAIKKFNKFLLRKKSKIYRNSDGTTKYVTLLSEVEREIQLHTGLNHKNIIQVYEVIDDIQRDKLYIVMENASRGTILNWNSKKQIFSFPENLPLDNEIYLKNVFSQCLEGLKYLHEQNIIHRDIKPQNILIDSNGDVKICDFGCAIRLENQFQKIKGTEGTFQFMAPESLSENKNDKSGFLGQLADLWSLGVVMYCIMKLKLPFYDENMMQLFNQIQNENVVLENVGYSKDLIDIVLSMLNKDPQLRPSINQILESIKQD